MTKNRKKIISKVIASGMLITSIPIQTFANEIENVIENNEEITNDKEVINDNIEKESENYADKDLGNSLNEKESIKNTEEGTDSNINLENSLIIEDNESNNSNILVKEVKEGAQFFADGNGTELNPYLISNAQELYQLSNQVNNEALNTTNLYYKLTADIDFANFDINKDGQLDTWQPIGTTANEFKGSFDGNNFTIKNINVNNQENSGIFGAINSATIKNLNVENISMSGTKNVGVIAGVSNQNTTIENIQVTNMNIENATSIGGIIGVSSGGTLNVQNIQIINESALDLSTTENVGGVVGLCQSNLNANDININLNITAKTNLGGLVGKYNDEIGEKSLNILNVTNNGNLNVLNSSGNIGGLIGDLRIADWNSLLCNITISNNKNYGDIIGGKYTGGLIGSYCSFSKYGVYNIKNNVNYGSICSNYIQYSSYAGGLMGYFGVNNAVLNMSNNIVNSDKIYADCSGGMIGDINKSGTTSIEVLDNTVNVKQLGIDIEYVSENVGGLFAYMSTYGKNIDVNILNNNISVNMRGEYVGGMVSRLSCSGGIFKFDNNNLNISAICEPKSNYGSTVFGGLVAYVYDDITLMSVENLNLNANLNLKNCWCAGGVTGRSTNITVKNSKINSNFYINNTNSNVNTQIGGISGYAEGNVLTDNVKIKSYAEGEYIRRCGGVAGLVSVGNIDISKTSVNTTMSGEIVGGFIGEKSGYSNKVDNYISIDSSYAIIDAINVETVAGIINIIDMIDKDYPINFSNIYTVLKLNEIQSKNVSVSPTVFDNDGKSDINYSNVYYDKTLIPIDNEDIVGLTTEQMQGKEPLNNMNFDFTNLWKLNKEYYPTFEQINTAPEIIVNPDVKDNTIVINQYDKFNPLDYVTTEDFEGDEVTVAIKETVDTSKYGTFPITYVATDSKGLSSELTLNLKINPLMIKVNEAPIIIAEDIILTIGDEFNPLKVIAVFDKEDGVLTSTTKVIENTVNMNKAGVYKVTYEVTDKDGAKATKTITVTVKEKVVSNNNPNNTTTTDDKKDTTTEKPQTSDIGFLGLSGILMSTVGLYSINRKKEE